MTKTDVANLALAAVGLPFIRSISESSADSRALALFYETAAREVLMEQEWRDAIAWSWLVDEAVDSYTSHDTNNTSGLGTLEVTTAIDAHTPRTGTITVTYDTGETDEYDYASWTGSIFTLASGNTLARTYDDGDTVTTTPNQRDDQYEYMYDVPSDCLKVLDLAIDPEVPWIVEGAYIFTNYNDEDEGIRMRYIKDIRDEVSSVVVYNEDVAQAISYRMAEVLAMRTDKTGRLRQQTRNIGKEKADSAVAAEADATQYVYDGAERWDEVE
tara:strand:+ start:5727 stop:6539 length:813 start_codon:yes stop_codon:yes gene_type:complete